MPIKKQICRGTVRAEGPRGPPLPGLQPPTDPQEYHEQRQDEDDGASQVGVLVLLELVVRVINELERHFLLVLIPPVQVPVQHHFGSLPFPDLQEHCGP